MPSTPPASRPSIVPAATPRNASSTSHQTTCQANRRLDQSTDPQDLELEPNACRHQDVAGDSSVTARPTFDRGAACSFPDIQQKCCTQTAVQFVCPLRPGGPGLFHGARLTRPSPGLRGAHGTWTVCERGGGHGEHVSTGPDDVRRGDSPAGYTGDGYRPAALGAQDIGCAGCLQRWCAARHRHGG
jgi:hypothetical protein